MFMITPVTLLHVPFEELIASIIQGVQDDPEGVLEWSSRALCDDPKNALAFFARGIAQLQLGHYSHGIADLQDAICRDQRFARGCELAVRHDSHSARAR